MFPIKGLKMEELEKFASSEVIGTRKTSPKLDVLALGAKERSISSLGPS